MTINRPKPLAIDWLKKSLTSANYGREIMRDGRVRFWIEHELLHGVTPAMLVWWFKNLEGDVEIDGRRFNRYRVWHPIDHVFAHYAKRLEDGTVGVGSVIHLAEMLGGDPKKLVHIKTTITKLDESGYVHEPRIDGVRLAAMEYEFEKAPGGTVYRNSLTIGFKGRFMRLLNPLVRRFVFDDARGLAWIRHNVEEVGNFESFLPRLYESEHGQSIRLKAA